jgi:uncharacterized protein YdhG (YjbR/CyaY superfamily)
MGKKGAMPTYATIDDYVLNQKEVVQPLLLEIRELILRAVPDAQEVKNYKVPCFILAHESEVSIQIMFSANAKGISFYPFEKAVSAFSNKLEPYKTGKGSVNFMLNKPLPKDLIVDMVKFRKKELEE